MFQTAAKLHWYLPRWRQARTLVKLTNELRREREMTACQWQELRNRRLRALLTFAGEHVPYYRRLFDQCGFDPSSADLPNHLRRIPILTKDLIRAHRDELIADTASASGLFKNASGGSTGVPLDFFQDQNYKTFKQAISVYYREWWGIRPYDRTATIWGGVPERRRLRVRCLNSFEMNGATMREFSKMLADWRPPYLFGYASGLATFAHFVKDNRISGLRFRAIRSGADMLWPHQRELIEEAFRSPVYNHYGSREVNNIAAECPEGRRMHLISTWRYVEIADEEGRPVPVGTPGSILVTDLTNCGMPFIRYRNEDVGALAQEPCSCGRASPVLDQLHGRTTDVIYSPSGEMIHGHFFAKLLQVRGSWFRQFQVYQPSMERLLVRYVPAGPGHQAAIREVLDLMAARLGPGVTLELEVRDQIPPLHNGKHCYVLSDVHSHEADRAASIST